MRDIPPEILEINKQLARNHGNLKGSELPLYRVSWSDDQLEKRSGEFEDRTPEGFLIRRVEEVRECKKYWYIRGRWVLERLIEVPLGFETQLVDELSYECIWVFEGKDKEPVPPLYRACDLIIQMIHMQAAKVNGVKYKDPDVVDMRDQAEFNKEKLKRLTQELFGNETDTSDALGIGDGIVVPSNYEKGVQ